MHMNSSHLKTPLGALALAAALFCSPASAAMVTDGHGNVAYDTAAECDAAMRAGTAKLYKSFTTKPPLLRAGEASVKVMSLRELSIPASVAQTQAFGGTSYANGACDIGVGRSGGRDGVAKPLIGKYVPYSADMPVNVYYDRGGNAVRASMKQCDNWFGGAFPRPVVVPVVARPAAPAPAPAPVAAPKPVVQAPAPVQAAAPAPVMPKPVAAPAAVAAAKGGISTATALGVGAALLALPLLLDNEGQTGTTGTAGTTGTTGP